MTLRVRDMPHMAQYVYDMYLDRVRQCKDQYEVSQHDNYTEVVHTVTSKK